MSSVATTPSYVSVGSRHSNLSRPSNPPRHLSTSQSFSTGGPVRSSRSFTSAQVSSGSRSLASGYLSSSRSFVDDISPSFSASWLSDRSNDMVESTFNAFRLLTGAPDPIRPVQAARRLKKHRIRRNGVPGTPQVRRTFCARTKGHTGYMGVDIHSLTELSCASALEHPLDCTNWEDRDVRQRFLDEHSLQFSRNWFGQMKRARGNKRSPYHPCRPRTMEMPEDFSKDLLPFEVKIESLDSDEETDFDEAEDELTFDESTIEKENASVDPFFGPKSQQPTWRPAATPLSPNKWNEQKQQKPPRLLQSYYKLQKLKDKAKEQQNQMNRSRIDKENGPPPRFFEGESTPPKSNRTLPTETVNISPPDKYATLDMNLDESFTIDDEDEEASNWSQDETLEDVQCGEFVNVKATIGEHVTRVHPDITVSLRHSRWRRKYFPRGTFPYK